jgi:hypothetical protein
MRRRRAAEEKREELSMNERVQTGKMQFENDWPGIFIRGDDALNYAAAIRILFAAGEFRDLEPDGGCRSTLSELAELLESCRVKSKSV